MLLVGNGAEVDDDDVLMAINIQDVLVLLSEGDAFLRSSNEDTVTLQQGNCVCVRARARVCVSNG